MHRSLNRGLAGVSVAIRALTTWSSCQRILGDLDAAHHGLVAALEAACHVGAVEIYNDVLERIIALIEDRGLYHDALAIAEYLVLRRATSGNVDGIGRALIEQGRMLGHLERFSNALRCLEGALQLLPKDEIANRFAALQCLGCVALGAGDTAAARGYADAARALSVDTRLAAGLAWLDAAIAGPDQRALSHYRRALRALAAVPEPLNAALVQVEMIRLHWQRSDHSQALRVAESLITHLNGLRSHSAAAEAVMEVVAAARLDRLDAHLLDEAESAITRGMPGPSRNEPG
ncbi:MAG: hypothetical protein AAGD38_04675 [Acidobacteriota bacterium]